VKEEIAKGVAFVAIPIEEWEAIKNGQQLILESLVNLGRQYEKRGGVIIDNISAKEYMAAIGIGRWKFNQLIAENKIKTIKKKRKIYVPISEIERYFNDPSI